MRYPDHVVLEDGDEVFVPVEQAGGVLAPGHHGFHVHRPLAVASVGRLEGDEALGVDPLLVVLVVQDLVLDPDHHV